MGPTIPPAPGMFNMLNPLNTRLQNRSQHGPDAQKLLKKFEGVDGRGWKSGTDETA